MRISSAATFALSGVTYSQAFELKYDGREAKEKDIPEMPWIFRSPFADKFTQLIQSHGFAIVQFLVEKIANLLGII